MHIALYFHFFSSEVPLSLTRFLIFIKSFFYIHTGFKHMILCTVIGLFAYTHDLYVIIWVRFTIGGLIP